MYFNSFLLTELKLGTIYYAPIARVNYPIQFKEGIDSKNEYDDERTPLIHGIHNKYTIESSTEKKEKNPKRNRLLLGKASHLEKKNGEQTDFNNNIVQKEVDISLTTDEKDSITQKFQEHTHFVAKSARILNNSNIEKKYSSVKNKINSSEFDILV